MRYTVTKEIKSETKVGKGLYAFDFMFIVIYLLVSYMLSNIVADAFMAPYFVFSIVMAVFLTMPSMFNRRRRNYQSLLLLVKRDTAVYRPVRTSVEREKVKEI